MPTNDELIVEIRFEYAMRQDYVKAQTKLIQQMGAQRCRLLCHGLATGDAHRCGRKGRFGLRHSEQDERDQPGIDTHRRPAALTDVAGGQREDVALAYSAPGGIDEAFMALAGGPYVEAHAVMQRVRLRHERILLALATQLPVWPWVESVRGFGAFGLAAIVGEAGDLGGYANPAKLWKRMGLAVINGDRQRKVTGSGALEHGYNPQRRAVMWVIGDSLIKGNRSGPYKTYYDEVKAERLGRVPEEWRMSEDGRRVNTAKLHAHNHAKRLMEKRLLVDLWRAWRDAPSAAEQAA